MVCTEAWREIAQHDVCQQRHKEEVRMPRVVGPLWQGKHKKHPKRESGEQRNQQTYLGFAISVYGPLGVIFLD